VIPFWGSKAMAVLKGAARALDACATRPGGMKNKVGRRKASYKERPPPTRPNSLLRSPTTHKSLAVKKETANGKAAPFAMPPASKALTICDGLPKS
jgi:hypothetical protein